MRRVRLGPDGLTSSSMAIGTWRLLDQAPDPQTINRLLNIGLELGITTVDTAEIYGRYGMEVLLGRALALSPGLRDRLEIVTKAGIYVPSDAWPQCRTAHYDATAARLVASLEASLRRLRVDRVELFLVHRPDWLAAADDTAAGLSRLLAEGKIRAAGVSNYTTAQVELLAAQMERPLAANQIEFHLLRREPLTDGTLAQCERLGMRPMAWSPLGGGRLFDPDLPPARRLAATAAAMAERYDGAGLDTLALAWIMAHPSAPVPVLGTHRPERLRAAVRAADITLNRQDWYALWEAAEGRRIP